MLLTATAIRTVKPEKSPIKLPDGAGLFLFVQPSGAKWWRFRYRFEGKEKMLSLGTYPEVSLKDARERRDDARKLLASGIDPSQNRKAVKAAKAETNSFEVIAREWIEKFSKHWASTHTSKIVSRLENDIFPWVKDKPIRDITAPDLLKCLRRIEARGAIETAHRTLQHCGQVFRYAIVTGRADRDISADLRGALPPVKQKHHASITDPTGIGALLRAIDVYQGSIVTRCALQLAPLVFVRPGELRKAEWKEIDFDKSEWRIPAERMKMRELHIVPLSKQAIAILREIQPLTGHSRYIFPGARTNGRPMSENAVTAALRRMGFSKDEMTGHGFRSMASTLLNEQGWNRDAIERQLAHAERNKIRGAYNYAQHLPERVKMMQAWADYLDALRNIGEKVIPIMQAR